MTRAESDGGIAAWRYRTGVTLMAIGGLVYIAATAAASDALFAVAIGLVGAGLLVHLSDPVVYTVPVTAGALALAAAAAFADAAMAASHSSGAGSAIALVVLVGGIGVAAWSRRRAG